MGRQVVGAQSSFVDRTKSAGLKAWMVFHWANTWKASSENEVALRSHAQDDPSYQAWLQQATPEELSALGNKKADNED
jgi:carotenoid cleavage dioxygenase-like enzyme